MEEKQPICVIEFRIVDQQRYELFQRFFGILREWSQERKKAVLGTQMPAQELNSPSNDDTHPNRQPPSSPKEWLLRIPADDLSALRLPPHAESIQSLQSWEELTRKERRKHIKAQGNPEGLKNLADFVDMIRQWEEIEFELLDCSKPAQDSGQIRYLCFQHPFLGKSALEETLMFFGFFSIINNTC